MEDINIKYLKLSDEKEKVKLHNRSLMTLLELFHEEEMEETTIYDAVVLFDLS